VGSPAVRRVDVRVIAATHRDLQAMVKDGRFRQDLYYRLGMVHINVPSLARREDDLPLLERYFRKTIRRAIRQTSPRYHPACNRLCSQSTPGREMSENLKNVLGSACMMTEAEAIDVGDLPEYIRENQIDSDQLGETLVTLGEMERKYALRVLQSAGRKQSTRLRTARDQQDKTLSNF